MARMPRLTLADGSRVTAHDTAAGKNLGGPRLDVLVLHVVGKKGGEQAEEQGDRPEEGADDADAAGEIGPRRQ